MKIKISAAVLLASDVFYNCLTFIHLHIFTFLAHFPYLKEKRRCHKTAMLCPAWLQLLDQMTGCHKTGYEPYTIGDHPNVVVRTAWLKRPLEGGSNTSDPYYVILLLLYALFWVITRRLEFICRRFGTLCLFHLHRQVDVSRMKLG